MKDDAMTAHQQTAEAASSPAPVSVDEKAADFEDFLFGDEDESPEPTDDETPTDDLDDTEEDALEDETDEDDEPEAPAIEPPVSLNAEEKSVFAQLPPEAQQAWAASETRRNQQVQEATTKASNAQREAEARAASANAEAKQVFASQLDEVLGAFKPAAPDPRLAEADPARYIAAKAHYDAQSAQFAAFEQQVKNIRTEANAEAERAFVEQRDRELMAIPEIANPETRNGYLEKAFGAADFLGLSRDEIAPHMSANDVKALATIADLKAKADKYDAALSRKMQRVRAGKGQSMKPGTAPHDSKPRAVKAGNAWSKVKGASNKAARDEALADYFEAAGIL